ncbi:MAG: nucleotidyl transferase AbiEii/AbiGii toxin family protein [Pseudomonadota bacterium]
MIEKNEILIAAKNLNLSPDTVEKDYVLGWMLHGIGGHKSTNKWAFKGGTSLKKCFFETFRFSEDLDYTLTDNSQLDSEFLVGVFSTIADSLNESVGIDFFPEKFKFKVIDKGNGNFSAQGKIHYNGPLNRKNGVATIKLDLTTDEILVLNTVSRKIQHPYTDEPKQGIYANCYAFEEVVAEKIRALAQRIRPRDLYDVVHFFRNREMIGNPQLVYNVLGQKCAFKGMDIPTFEYIENHEKIDELEPQWDNMLTHQLPSLPPMNSFWADLEPFFDWLKGQLEVEKLVPASIVSGDVFQVGRYGYIADDVSGLNKIQFAAANRVCIKLRYSDKTRIVEPLSFRINTKTGNKLFYGYERDAEHPKAYSVSKIQSVEITNIPYTEKYPVEISATGSISMPPIRKAVASRVSSLTRPSKRYSSSGGYPYKILCPICQKTFSRKRVSDTKLNKHKNQYGGACSGRRGYVV